MAKTKQIPETRRSALIRPCWLGQKWHAQSPVRWARSRRSEIPEWKSARRLIRARVGLRGAFCTGTVQATLEFLPFYLPLGVPFGRNSAWQRLGQLPRGRAWPEEDSARQRETPFLRLLVAITASVFRLVSIFVARMGVRFHLVASGPLAARSRCSLLS